MSARRATQRGYLAQLANPVPAGGPVFSARRDLFSQPSNAAPQIPVIEDVIVSATRQPAPTATLPPARLSSTSSSANAIQSPGAGNKATASDSPTYPPGESTTVHGSAPSIPDREFLQAGTYVSPSPLGRGQSARIEQTTSSDKPSASTLLQTLSDGSADRAPIRGREVASSNAHAAPGPIVSSAMVSSARSQMEAEPSAASGRAVSMEPAQNAPSVTPSAQRDGAQETADRQRRNPEPAKAGPAAKTSSRVVIGTVEIRTKISPPPPQTVPPPRGPESYAAHLATRAAHSSTDALARSLAWNYGLIQG